MTKTPKMPSPLQDMIDNLQREALGAVESYLQRVGPEVERVDVDDVMYVALNRASGFSGNTDPHPLLLIAALRMYSDVVRQREQLERAGEVVERLSLELVKARQGKA